MSRKTRKNKDLVILSILSLIAAFAVYFLIEKKIEIAFTIIAGGFSFAFGLRQYQIENDRIFKELFTAFNEKYDLRFNDTLNKIAFEIQSGNSYVLTSSERKLIIDYLNLCAEEYLWYTKGRIDENVWNAWEVGISFFTSLPPIAEVAAAEQSVKGSYYGLFDRISPNQQHG